MFYLPRKKVAVQDVKQLNTTAIAIILRLTTIITLGKFVAFCVYDATVFWDWLKMIMRYYADWQIILSGVAEVGSRTLRK